MIPSPAELAARCHTVEFAAGRARQAWGERPTVLCESDTRRMRSALEILAAEIAALEVDTSRGEIAAMLLEAARR